MVPTRRTQASDEHRHDRDRCGSQQPDQDDDRTTQNQPAPSVLQGQPATTKAGKPRQRLTWTTEMNTAVMQCYYQATKLDTMKIGYREEMYNLFLQAYPQFENIITAQRLIDQKRTIIMNKRLSEIELENIKQTVATHLEPAPTQSQTTAEEHHTNTPSHSETQTQTVSDEQNRIKEHTDANNNLTATINPSQIIIPALNSATDNNINEIETKFITNTIKWKNTDPTSRPPLPKLIFKEHTNRYINAINNYIADNLTYIEETQNLEEYQTLIYTAAATIIELNKQNIRSKNSAAITKPVPKWQIRLNTKINKLRKDIAIITQHNRGNTSKKVTNHLSKIIKDNEPLTVTLDTLKQKLQVYAYRLRKYKESNERKKQNTTFKFNEKAFYKKLTESPNQVEINPPTKQQIQTYWQDIWSKTENHNNNTWIIQEQETYSNISTQNNPTITLPELTTTIKNTHNWKYPGIDHIHNYWYKTLTSTHNKLLILINDALQNSNTLPPFLTQGITFIKPKNNNTNNPANYRPITCLPTLYKIITSLISQKIYSHLIDNNILTNEQKGCRKQSQGCKEQLIIDQTITQQAVKEQRNLHTCYIDYKKAFDKIPHSWLIHVLKIYKIHPKYIKFLEKNMKNWKTKIHLKTPSTNITTDMIKINTGIFQGDALSALWFCISLNPLSNLLNRTEYGFNIRNQKQNVHKINHLLYMDDIKLYAKNQQELQRLIKIIEKFTTDIKMEFGIDKCKTQHIERGLWTNRNTTETLNSETLQNMDENEYYKYLGFKQNIKIDHPTIKKELTEAYLSRLNKILKSYLNSKNLFKAINTYAIPLLTYSFGVIKWTETDIQNLMISTRTKLTKYNKHHPHACKERIIIPRKNGGRGLIDIQQLHNNQINNLRTYFHKQTTALHKAIVCADKELTPLNLHNQNLVIPRQTLEETITTWKQKQIHGKHPHIVENGNIDKQNTYTWLRKGDLQPETEGFIIGIQDQIIATRNYRKYIIKDPTITNDRCRKCNIHAETIDHITSGCPILVGTQYTKRHDIVAKIIHKEIANKLNLINNTAPYYQYTPETILENEDFKLYWDRTIYTDKTIPCNRPDITIINKKEKTTKLIEISVPNDNNIHTKYTEKIEKYTELAQEIKNIWKQNDVKILPIIISATGILHKTFIQNMKASTIDEKIHSQIQKAVILKTCNIVRSFLNN